MQHHDEQVHPGQEVQWQSGHPGCPAISSTTVAAWQKNNFTDSSLSLPPALPAMMEYILTENKRSKEEFQLCQQQHGKDHRSGEKENPPFTISPASCQFTNQGYEALSDQLQYVTKSAIMMTAKLKSCENKLNETMILNMFLKARQEADNKARNKKHHDLEEQHRLLLRRFEKVNSRLREEHDSMSQQIRVFQQQSSDMHLVYRLGGQEDIDACRQQRHQLDANKRTGATAMPQFARVSAEHIEHRQQSINRLLPGGAKPQFDVLAHFQKDLKSKLYHQQARAAISRQCRKKDKQKYAAVLQQTVDSLKAETMQKLHVRDVVLHQMMTRLRVQEETIAKLRQGLKREKCQRCSSVLAKESTDGFEYRTNQCAPDHAGLQEGEVTN